MDDLISRQDAIDWCLEGLNNMPSAEAVIVANGWIPVTEKLPEMPYGCLVTVLDDDYYGEPFPTLLPYFVGWDGKQWNDGDGMQCPFEVTAWMPLPDPYKGGEEP